MVAVALLAFVVPPKAGAAVTCNLDTATSILDVTMSANGDFPQFSVSGGGGIVVDDAADASPSLTCTGGAPTVTNVDLIDVEQATAGQNGQVNISIPATGFGPGASTEPNGVSEIEFVVNLGSGISDSVGINTTVSDDTDHFRFGSLAPGVNGANLNAPEPGGPDGNDVTFMGVESVNPTIGFLETDPNTVDASGGGPEPEFVGPFADSFMNFGGVQGNDTLIGGDGGNVVNGFEGNDQIVSSPNFDILRGDAGIDTVSYSRATGPATVDLGMTVGQDTGGGGFDIFDQSPDIENVTGGPFGDTLTGTNGANHMDGKAGVDTLSLLDGPDEFNALDQGPDTLNCGDGTDSGVADAVGVDTLTNCENVNFPPETMVAGGPADGGFTNDATPVYTLTANEPASFEYRVDGGSFHPCAADCETSSLADGQHQLTFRATDSTPLIEQTPVTRTVNVDTVFPDAAVTSGPSGLINHPTPTFGFSAEAGANVACGIDGAFGPCSGPGDSHTATNVADGQRTFQVRASDAAGNETIASRSFTLDTDPPDGAIKRIKIKDDDAKARFGSDEPGSTFSCRVDRKWFKPCQSPLKVKNLNDGKHKLFVQATDLAGNTDPTSAKKKFEIDD